MKSLKPLHNAERGAAIVEFALVSLVLYLLVAGGIELGRIILVSQVLQDAARVGARELAVTPLAAEDRLEDALADPGVQTTIWNENLLVIDLACYPTPELLNAYVNSLPAVNKILRGIFISETVTVAGTERRLLRYPGALLGDTTNTTGQRCPPLYDGTDLTNPSNLTVRIPQVDSRGVNGAETISWIPVLAEARNDPGNPASTSGPFSYASTGTQKGLAAITINYPFQAASLSGFQKSAGAAPLDPNVGNVIQADDNQVVQSTALPPNTVLLNPQTDRGTYNGPFGLGRQFAMTKVVRPYRRLLSGEAIFRREVIQ